MAKKIDTVLSEALTEKNLITKKDLEGLLKEIEQSGQSLQRTLINRGLLSEREILNILSKKLKVPFISLREVTVAKSVLDKIPVKVASYYGFFPYKIENRNLTIAVSSPLDIKTQDEIRTQLGLEIETVFSTNEDILDALKRHYGLAADTVEKIVSTKLPSEAATQKPGDGVEDIEKLVEDASVIKLVNQVILEAYRRRATDIHIEPYRDGVVFRYRIDGILYDANVPTEMKNFINAIIFFFYIMPD